MLWLHRVPLAEWNTLQESLRWPLHFSFTVKLYSYLWFVHSLSQWVSSYEPITFANETLSELINDLTHPLSEWAYPCMFTHTWLRNERIGQSSQVNQFSFFTQTISSWNRIIREWHHIVEWARHWAWKHSVYCHGQWAVWSSKQWQYFGTRVW